MSLRHLGDGTTHLRNPHIARIARRQGLIEKLGTGIKLILESCEKENLRPLSFKKMQIALRLFFIFAKINRQI